MTGWDQLSRAAAMSTDEAGVGRAPSLPEYGYRAFGLAVRSHLELPELIPDSADIPDLTIRLKSANAALSGPLGEATYEFGAGSQYLAWRGVGGFRIKGVSAIEVEPAPGARIPLLNLPLLGPVMALLLHLRGMLVLHASAVDVRGRSALFLGAKGAGKSTCAAAFVAAGHPLITDDVTAVDFSDPTLPLIVPGFPQLKLVEDAAASLVLEQAVTMPRPAPEFPKLQRRLTASFSYVPVRSHAAFLLTKGSAPALTPLSPRDALAALIEFSFASIFRRRNRPLGKAEADQHLRQCASLAGTLKVCRLEVPTGLHRLREVVDLVERNL